MLGHLHRSLPAFIALTGLVFMNAAALANFERAKELYAGGEFEAAANEALVIQTADGYALAAQALLVDALFFLEGEPRLKAFERAHELALSGLELDPNHNESHLQAAGALGLQARVKNSGRLGRQARDHLKAILRIDPNHAKALAATGGWHGEVLHRAGRLVGKIFFGASRKSAFLNFDRAIDLRPDLPSLRIAYSKTLLRFPSRYRPRATALLREALAMPPPDRLEALTQTYGRLILEAVEKGDKAGLKALLEDVPADDIRIKATALP